MKILTTKKQMLVYAISGLGVNMLNLMMGSYLCSALIASGFGEKAIPFQTFEGHDLVIAALWATFALIAKILDGVIDIPMASFTDRLKTRFGRRRPALVIGLVPMILAYILFAAVTPNPEGATVLNTVFYGIILCVFYSFYTLTMVTYYATFTEIVDTTEKRNFISNVKSVCDIAYFILGYVVVRAMLNGMNIRPVALIVLPLVATMIIPLFMIKEPSTLDGVEEAPETVNLVKSIGCTFKNRDFIIWMVVYSFMTFGVQLFLGGINEYFSYVGMSMIFVMVSSFAPVPFTLILYNKLIEKFGFGWAFRYVLVTFTVSMMMLFGFSFLPAGTGKTVASILGGLVASLGIGALFSVAYSVPAQLAADEEKKTGISNSAMYFAVQGLFAGVAAGIGTGVVLTALKKAVVNGGSAIVYMTLVASIGAVLAFVFTFILPESVKVMGKGDGKLPKED